MVDIEEQPPSPRDDSLVMAELRTDLLGLKLLRNTIYLLQAELSFHTARFNIVEQDIIRKMTEDNVEGIEWTNPFSRLLARASISLGEGGVCHILWEEFTLSDNEEDSDSGNGEDT